ncbi:E3 ubiquitin-protein ligase RNF217 [Antennarius striatus]|uniref:E3 ubiquitin-protein ligase RNF217 n=1 Tax=Antennarius striatus TaxID=241820 RepID=UPI0035B348E5
MGRAVSGMDHDGPTPAACRTPSFISTFEEGRVKSPHNRPSETSRTESKVERFNLRVSRSNSRLSLDGGSERKPDEDDKDATGDKRTTRGERRRRASAVEILRRNFGVSKSPSLRLNTNSWVQGGAEDGNRGGNINGEVTEEHGRECEGFKKSDIETGDAAVENEPTSSDLETSDLQRVSVESAHRRRSDGSTAAGSFHSTEHVYCTVYCIASDSRQKEITGVETVTSDAPESNVDNRNEAGSTSEPELYTVEDLADRFGYVNSWLPGLRAGEGTAIQSCRVCLEGKPIAPLPCCRKPVCDECLKLYVSSQVRIAKSDISCPIPECSGYLEEGLVISHLTNEDLAKYHYFLELSQLDTGTKPCPQCSHFTSLKECNLDRSEHKYKIQCKNCHFLWCFKCHAPWHNGLRCREYRKGDKLLRTWASVIEHGQRNAQKCPQCKIHIQRTEGCDHMTCTQCNTNFCYRCGERYRRLRFFGDHTSNLSVFGCKYRYLPNKPHLRRLVRGSICATKVLIAPVVIILVMVFGSLALVIGLVVFPVYYVCKKRRKNRTEGSGRWI